MIFSFVEQVAASRYDKANPPCGQCWPFLLLVWIVGRMGAHVADQDRSIMKRVPENEGVDSV